MGVDGQPKSPNSHQKILARRCRWVGNGVFQRVHWTRMDLLALSKAQRKERELKQTALCKNRNTKKGREDEGGE